MEYLQALDARQIANLFHIRDGETRIGQTAMCGEDFLKAASEGKKLPKYVVLGIPEDIGPRANRGRGGAAHMWDWFIKSIVLVQDNDFLSGENICLLGTVTTSDLMEATPEKFTSNTDYDRAYLLLQALDMRVAAITAEIFKHHCIPVIIGGGHNNAYGIIKGFKTAFNENLSVVNLDPHADLRDTKSTHSGNSFSRALDENMLDAYINIGFHESYNNRYIMQRMSDKMV
jgi:formiminoglutamase